MAEEILDMEITSPGQSFEIDLLLDALYSCSMLSEFTVVLNLGLCPEGA